MHLVIWLYIKRGIWKKNITKSIKVEVIEKETSDGGEDNTDKPSSEDDNEDGSKPSDDNNNQGDNSDSVTTGDANNYGVIYWH